MFARITNMSFIYDLFIATSIVRPATLKLHSSMHKKQSFKHEVKYQKWHTTFRSPQFYPINWDCLIFDTVTDDWTKK